MVDLIADVKQLNRQILNLARTGDWEELTNVVKQRHQAIEQYFNLSAEIVSETYLTELNNQILDVDNQVKNIISKEKDQSIKSSLNLKNAHQAIKHYEETSVS